MTESGPLVYETPTGACTGLPEGPAAPGHHFLTVWVSVFSARRPRPAPGAGTALRPCPWWEEAPRSQTPPNLAPLGPSGGGGPPSVPAALRVLLRPRRPGIVKAMPRRAGRGPRGGGARREATQQMGSRVNAAPRPRGVPRGLWAGSHVCRHQQWEGGGKLSPTAPPPPTGAHTCSALYSSQADPCVRCVTAPGACSAAAGPASPPLPQQPLPPPGLHLP